MRAILIINVLVIVAGGSSLAGGFTLLHPKGPVADAQIGLMGLATGLMLVVVLPVFMLLAVFVRRYAATTGRGEYRPDWGSSWRLELAVWGLPILIVSVLAYLVWTQTHRLDPYRPLATAGAALTVQAVALDWQWLFIYPEQGIASVNELVIPAGRDVGLQITSDTVMNAFYLPQLAGQIYAMAGMVTQLHVLADQPGEFAGRNAQFSGAGFAKNTFVAKALDTADFNNWVTDIKRGDTVLDAASYAVLAQPTISAPTSSYAKVDKQLFDTLVSRYAKGPVAPHQTISAGE